MSTMDMIGIGYRAARQAARDRRAQRAGTVRSRSRAMTVMAEHGLTIAGFGCFTAAAAMIAVPLALVVAGVALFVLELRMGE